ncbi:hypothetical protein CC80DRAFT_571781 [Byssothecium circinans]|uniref:Uncharacterized protein n=1 Tax=Byssothecium circinans TaxID=147558 RepID=A0A6A5TLN6_9PLEO|nr:hypothetical protein CC80DRAFT_571781 [Byssothecium circinans]
MWRTDDWLQPPGGLTLCVTAALIRPSPTRHPLVRLRNEVLQLSSAYNGLLDRVASRHKTLTDFSETSQFGRLLREDITFKKLSALNQLEGEMSESRAAQHKAASPEAARRSLTKALQPPEHGSSKGKCPKPDKAKPAQAKFDPPVAMPDISKLPRRKPPVATATALRKLTFTVPDESVTHAQEDFEAKADEDNNLLNTVIDPGPDSQLKFTRFKQSDRFGVYSFGQQSSTEKKSARRNCRAWKDRRRFQYSHQANGVIFLILRYPGRQSSIGISSSSTIAQSAASLLDALSKPQDSPFHPSKRLSAYVDSRALSLHESVPDAKDCTSTPYYTMPITGKTINKHNKAYLQGVSFSTAGKKRSPKGRRKELACSRGRSAKGRGMPQ